MIILCTGMFRGGSTWSFNIAKSIIRDGNPNATIFSEYNECVKKVINDKIDEFDNIILKCHKVDTFGKSLIRHNCVKVIYTYRNPMESITSGIQVFDQKFDDILITMKNSLEFLQFQKKFKNVCLIPKENIGNYQKSDVLPEHVLKKIKQETKLDHELYKFGKELFNKRLSGEA